MSSTAPVTELRQMSAEGSDGSGGSLLPVIRGGDCHPRPPPGCSDSTSSTSIADTPCWTPVWSRPRMQPTRPAPRGQGDVARIVPLVIGTVLFVSGVVIFGRVPSTLDHVLAER